MILNFYAAKQFIRSVDEILTTWDNLRQQKKLGINGYSLSSMENRLRKTRNRIVLDLKAEQILFEGTNVARAEATQYEISKEDSEAIVMLTAVIARCE